MKTVVDNTKKLKKIKKKFEVKEMDPSSETAVILKISQMVLKKMIALEAEIGKLREGRTGSEALLTEKQKVMANVGEFIFLPLTVGTTIQR